MYDKFRDAYTLYAQIEVDCANYVKANFEDLRDQASLVRQYKLYTQSIPLFHPPPSPHTHSSHYTITTHKYQVNRDYVVECFFHKHPILKELIVVKFEPYGQDTVSGLNRDHGAEIFLDKDARKWATKLTKDQQIIATYQKQVKGLQSVTSAYTKVVYPATLCFSITSSIASSATILSPCTPPPTCACSS